MNGKKLVVGVTGASGAVYAQVLFNKLLSLSGQLDAVGVVMSDNAKEVWRIELGDENYAQYPFRYFNRKDFNAPFASGSTGWDALIVCPCSMGTLGRIAAGISDELITRTADVMLKERRRLILVIRETPYNLIHINNMKSVTEAGGIICPASPSFYSKPENFGDLASSVVDRALSLAGIQTDAFSWGE